ncbi:hypothetical protein [Aureimonas altamirensis]|uniref:hypothetical protein n=1 Tax=Aureimonas altamirensis TaxID=370622 RepID=UPI0025573646|nr:hypothetical protein [Aureimonas altamirensis]
MSKRPSVFGGLSTQVPTGEGKPTQPNAPSPSVAAAEKEKTVVKTSTYLPIEVHEVLREIAFHERTKVHDLLMEGVEHVLKTRRHPTIAELKDRT